MSLDTDVLIIGAGMSGLGLAVQLQRNFPQASFELIEKADNIGGTWWVNTYPGCGCDVASHLYSYSFALKPDWSRKYALQPEIFSYFRSVAQKYDIIRHVSFHSSVQKADFDETTGTWLVTILDQKTNRVYQRRAKILVSAVGALSVPKECDIKGAEEFKGKLFHSAQWDHSFDWAGKEVVVIGNGCSATQFVPIMTGGEKRVKKLTQFSRQAHWLAERPNPNYSNVFKWTMRYVPLAMRLYRFWHYYLMESDWPGFHTESGRKIREGLVKTQIDYIKRTAPERYHEALIPKTEIGCKRKVLDTDYLACLHRDNMELVYADPIEEITARGVRTRSGREVDVDAIILATGFKAQQVLYPLEIKGRNGINLNEHWDKFSSGVAQAYYGTCVSQFPNFFIMMGPNTATGHLSVIYTTECQINFTLRTIRPILRTLYPSLLSSGLRRLVGPGPDTVAVTEAAEQRDNTWIQSTSKQLVWTTGCTSWYVDTKTGRNTMLYTDWQWKYWLRSIFIPFRSDFVFETSPVPIHGTNKGQRREAWGKSVLITSGIGIAIGVGLFAGSNIDLKQTTIGRVGLTGGQNALRSVVALLAS
ncbi:hypothetical protein AJ79_00774 [Helicocarpus griseus UAMH5409]|uniref:L-ornithine N(5)-oxygenase n=1 Tax=Helicocarpus griseus UAMH5409 TaxID=1447875 RepID=A0A2B7Y9E7_9EURO|nr:hypothetical protein AJ79_00774 [Helicocarpus griseus UAMH5409]